MNLNTVLEWIKANVFIVVFSALIIAVLLATLGLTQLVVSRETKETLGRELQTTGQVFESLMKERAASPRTIESYRDTFRLLIAFAQRRLKKPPTKLAVQDLDAPFGLLPARGTREKNRSCPLGHG